MANTHTGNSMTTKTISQRHRLVWDAYELRTRAPPPSTTTKALISMRRARARFARQETDDRRDRRHQDEFRHIWLPKQGETGSTGREGR